MADRDQEDPPEREPDERMYTSEPLEDEAGREYVIQQQNVGPGNELGGGEWPDPDTPPRAPAAGAAGADGPDDDVDPQAVSTRTADPRVAASPRRRRPRPDPT
jgi:hypothetical protein